MFNESGFEKAMCLLTIDIHEERYLYRLLVILHVLTPSQYILCNVVDILIGAFGRLDCLWINIIIYEHGNCQFNTIIDIFIITSNARIIISFL